MAENFFPHSNYHVPVPIDVEIDEGTISVSIDYVPFIVSTSEVIIPKVSVDEVLLEVNLQENFQVVSSVEIGLTEVASVEVKGVA